MYYTIYKTTNLLNGKFYIGKHQTQSLNDGYFGSGKFLIRAIRKYGIENFITEIIEIFKTEHEMNLAEQILVVCDVEVSYNLCAGGKGGFSYINTHDMRKEWNRRGALKINKLGLNGCIQGGKTIKKKKIGIFSEKNFRIIGFCNPIILKEMHKRSLEPAAREKRKETCRRIGHQRGEKNSQFGKPRSEETKRKIRNSILATISSRPSMK